MADNDQSTRTTATTSSPIQHEAGIVSETTKSPVTSSIESAERATSASPPPRESTDIHKSSSASPPLGQSSTSPASQSPASLVVPESRTTTTATPEAEPRDPQVADLKAIFPDYDEAILQSVLESVNGNQDRAVDLLLGMSDPDFQPTTVPQPEPVQTSQMTQEQLDEELARRLMIEEQEQMTQWQVQQQMQEQQQRQRQRPHRSRSTRTQGGVQQQQPNSNAHSGQPDAQKDTMTEFQEQFSKIAETGKKTFGAFVSRVKAKIQEFDKPGPSSGGQVEPNWGNNNAPPASYYDPNPAQSPPQTNYQQYHGSQNPPTTTTNTTTQHQQQPAFYDPNPSSSAQFVPPTVPSVTTAQNPFADGYDAAPLPPSTGAAPSSTSTERPRSTILGSGAFTSNPSTSVPSSPPARGPSPANPIDGGKLGLLPKRPISLIRDPPPTQAQKQRGYDDDDLEYAESPFDDRK